MWCPFDIPVNAILVFPIFYLTCKLHKLKLYSYILHNHESTFFKFSFLDIQSGICKSFVCLVLGTCFGLLHKKKKHQASIQNTNIYSLFIYQQYIDEFDIDLVNQALTFNTTDMHIQGTCDLFTTKPIGADRKLYKVLDKRFSNDDEETLVNGESAIIDGSNNNHAPNLRKDSNSSSYSNNSSKSLDTLNSQFVKLKNRSLSYSYTKPLNFETNQINLKRSHSFHSPEPEQEQENEEIKSPFGPLNKSSSRKLFGYLIGALNATYPDHDFSTVEPNHFTLIPSSSDLIAKVNSFLISSGKSTGLDWIWQTVNTHIHLDHCLCFQFEPPKSFVDDLPGVIWCNMYFMFNKKKKRVAFLYFLATVLNETGNGTSNMIRRNSKVGTLDEEGMQVGEDDSEYDLRYSNDYGPIYEDVFDEDQEIEEEDVNMNDDAHNIVVEGEHGAEEFRYDDYDDDYAMNEDNLPNEHQDDEGFV